MADNVHDKIEHSLRQIRGLENQEKSPQQQAILQAEWRKIRALEEFVRMPYADYLRAHLELQRCNSRAIEAKTEMVEAKSEAGHFDRQEVH